MRETVRSLIRWTRTRIARTWRSFREPAGGPAGRLRRRALIVATMVTALTGLVSFPEKVTSGAAAMCRPWQGLADLCGAAGIPGLPTGTQREAYEKLPKENCDALENYRERFPKSPFDETIQRRLLLKREVFSDTWIQQTERRMPRYVSAQMKAFDDEAAAVLDAENQAMAAANRECRGDTEFRRFVSASVDKTVPACRTNSHGHICALHYEVICKVQARAIIDICS